MTCAWCTASLRGYRADARYCSGTCRVAAHRSQKRHDTKAKRAQRRVTRTELRHSQLLQLQQYREVVASGGGTDWTRAKIQELQDALNN